MDRMTKKLRFQSINELNYVESITLEILDKIENNLKNTSISISEKNFLESNQSVLKNFLNKIYERKALL